MKLERIGDAGSPRFRELWELYESAFPPDERRDIGRQKALFSRPEYRLFAAVDGRSGAPGGGAAVTGLLSLWEFGDFVFMEHLAVKEKMRGKGAGTAILKEYLAGCRVPVLLEVERPQSGIQKKRVAFYQKLGFRLNPWDYIQPPYAPAKKPVPMFLMSLPEAMGEGEFAAYRKRIHAAVYGLEKPLV